MNTFTVALCATHEQVRRWQSRDWADRLAGRQATRARDANDGRWNGRFSGRQWKENLAACGYRCYWCGIKLPAQELTVDHLYPLNFPGARNDIHSVVPACKSCNSARGAKSVEEFMRWLVARDLAGSEQVA